MNVSSYTFKGKFPKNRNILNYLNQSMIEDKEQYVVQVSVTRGKYVGQKDEVFIAVSHYWVDK